jgi:hypothetical protein
MGRRVVAGDVRIGVKTEVCPPARHVRSTLRSRHRQATRSGPVRANNRPRTTYAFTLARALRVGEHAIIGTFALDGPERCSGLPVVRYDAASLGKTLGPAFRLIETRRHEHLTPMGAYSDSSSVGSNVENSTRARFRLRSFKSLPKQLLRGERKSPHRWGRLESAKSAQHIVGGLQWQIGNQIRAFTPRPAWP